VTKLSDVFEYLSDSENMEAFLDTLNVGMWDEWDTGLEEASKMFGPMEFAIAARAASSFALYAEERQNN
jgi:hypothetical protein